MIESSSESDHHASDGPITVRVTGTSRHGGPPPAGPGITDVKSHRHESSFRLVRAGGGGSLPGGSGLRRPRPQRHLKSQPAARRARGPPLTEADCDGNRDGDRGLRLTRHSGWQFSASDSDGEPTAAATEAAAPRPRRPGSGPRPRRHWYCCTLALPGRRLSLRVTVTPVAVTSPTVGVTTESAGGPTRTHGPGTRAVTAIIRH